jgi:hypothetical protein
MPLGQGLVDRHHYLIVAQYLIGLSDPRSVQVFHQPVAKAALRTVRLNHAWPSRAAGWRHSGATTRG